MRVRYVRVRRCREVRAVPARRLEQHRLQQQLQQSGQQRQAEHERPRTDRAEAGGEAEQQAGEHTQRGGKLAQGAERTAHVRRRDLAEIGGRDDAHAAAGNAREDPPGDEQSDARGAWLPAWGAGYGV